MVLLCRVVAAGVPRATFTHFVVGCEQEAPISVVKASLSRENCGSDIAVTLHVGVHTVKSALKISESHLFLQDTGVEENFPPCVEKYPETHSISHYPNPIIPACAGVYCLDSNEGQTEGYYMSQQEISDLILQVSQGLIISQVSKSPVMP